MERVPVDSEMIASVGFEDSTLEVEFNSGAVYQYFDVPESEHDALMAAESHGRYLSSEIKGNYRYAKL